MLAPRACTAATFPLSTFALTELTEHERATTKTKIVKPNAAGLKELAAALKADGVVVFPTETVYGLGCSAFSAAGKAQIYKLKGRSFHNPLQMLVGSAAEAERLAQDIPSAARRLMKKFWPGPMTLVLNASDLGRILNGGKSTVGLRMPDNKAALSLVKKAGGLLVSTSANLSGRPAALDARQAAKIFNGKVPVVMDGGKCAVACESTVVDMSCYPYAVRRAGAIPKSEIEKMLC